jgi:hypothetical protein
VAPFHALDLPPGTRITGYGGGIDLLNSVVDGRLDQAAGGRPLAYSLRYRMTADREMRFTELLPWPHGRGAQLPYMITTGHRPEGVPRPTAGLDPVGALIWDVDHGNVGLWVVARSLAA